MKIQVTRTNAPGWPSMPEVILSDGRTWAKYIPAMPRYKYVQFTPSGRQVPAFDRIAGSKNRNLMGALIDLLDALNVTAPGAPEPRP